MTEEFKQYTDKQLLFLDALMGEAKGSIRNSIAAAVQILDRTGLVKKEQIEVTNKGGGVFILPPKAVDDVG